jgi:hypothetical protein
MANEPVFGGLPNLAIRWNTASIELTKIFEIRVEQLSVLAIVRAARAAAD